MARIRSIKPQAFTSESLADVSVHARWTFAGLWTYVDDEGRGKADPRLIKGQLWPLDDDVTSKDVAGYLDELEAEGMVCRYEVDGRLYLHVVHWHEHQSINKATDSKLPTCPHHDRSTDPAGTPNGLGEGDSRSATGELPESYRGEQGTGNKEVEQGSGTGTPAPDSSTALVLVTADAVTVRQPTFEDFWRAYPKKRSRADAQRAWAKVIKAGKVSAAEVVAAAGRLRDDPNLPDLTYVPNGATWLNGERWNDDPYPPRRDQAAARPSTTDSKVQAALELAATFADDPRGAA